MSVAAGEPSSSDSRQRIQQAKQGCDTALGQLLDDARGYLLHAAGAAIDSDVRAQLSASDLVQQTLLDAHGEFKNFQGHDTRQLHAWLRRILINNLLNQYRRLRRSQKRDVSREYRDVNVDNVVAADGETPSSMAIRHEESASLEEALAGLPDHYREIIHLRHRQHLSFVEIGERLSKSADSVRKLWYRALDQLSKDLEKRLGR